MTHDETDEQLRRECVELIVYLGGRHWEEHNIDKVLHLCRQREAAGVRMAQAKLDERFGVTDHRIDRVRDFRLDEHYKWLEAKALEGG